MRMTQLVGRYFFLLAMPVALGASPAQAVPVTFNFSGIVSFSDPALAPITAAQPITGSYTFESTASDSNPLSSFGNYLNAIQSGSITVGAYTGNITGGSISVLNTTLFDSYNIEAQVSGAPLASGFQLTNFSLSTFGQFPSSGDALPTSPGDLSDFSNTVTLLLFPNSAGSLGLAGSFSPTVLSAAIPEPGTFLLFGLGLFLLAFWVRRKMF